jgi:hypothetical protein
LASEDERQDLFSKMETRFGIAVSTFEDYLLFNRQQSWSLLKKNRHISSFAQIKQSRIGLKAFQRVGSFVKPTTRMIQVFGRKAVRGLIQIDEARLARLLAGEAVSMDFKEGDGYAILRHSGFDAQWPGPAI